MENHNRLIKGGCVDDIQLDCENLVLADFHIHSKYSRATSPQMEVDTLTYWAERKGIHLLGTGDFTHPAYFKELTEKLEEDESGFYRLKGHEGSVKFVPTAETSHIYKQGGKCRRVHMLLMAQSLETANEINRMLASRGNIASDGRPILGLPAKQLCKLVREIDPNTIIVPAHIWTPWFSVLGEKSGFDSLEECFEDQLDMISGIETGLSSDPEMNWRLSQLDPYTIISNSDAHSPGKIGRECNAFAGPLEWTTLRTILRNKGDKRFKFTIEFFPEEGKYHWPGHLKCKMSVSPEEYKKTGGKCPVCGKAVTAGVASRVEMLADRPEGFVSPGNVHSVHLIPLNEVIGEAFGKRATTKPVQKEWDNLIESGHTEIEILMFLKESELSALTSAPVVDAILRMRSGDVEAIAGYDGQYGQIKILGNKNTGSIIHGAEKEQLSLIG